VSVLLIVFFLLALLAIGAPVGFALLVAGSAGLLSLGGWPMLSGILATSPLSTPTSYELITVPMFMLMAEFVVLSGIADDLFRAAAIWVGRIPGGLGIATALAGAGFGAISGSSTASAATLSATSIPAMLRQGYEPRIACGAVAISGTLAMLIPPSIALVIYGLIADVSIGQLLVAGIIPGLLVSLTICLTIFVLALLHPDKAPTAGRHSLRQKLASLKVVGPMLVLLLAVTGVIYAGIATPTEASGIGAFGAFLLAAKSGRLNFDSLFRALARAAGTTCMVILIIMAAKVFGYFLTITQLTQTLVAWTGGLDQSRWVILAIILFGYLLLGCFLDQVAILILTVPVALPVILHLGFDPVWFGVIIVVMAEVGLVTPPIGLNVFVVARYTGRPVEQVFAGVFPHVVAHLLLVVLLVAVPQIVLWLPSTMFE